MVLSPACPSDQAHLRSHSGPGSSGVLLGAPTGPEYRVLPEHFRTQVLERLHLPLQLVEAGVSVGQRWTHTGDTGPLALAQAG